VRYKNESHSANMRQVQHQSKNAVGSLTIQISSGFVREYACRLARQRARNCHALALTTRQLRGAVSHTICQTDLRKDGLRSLAR
jgi:hypothetical protein